MFFVFVILDKLPSWNLHFLVFFVIDKIHSWKEMKEVISAKLQTENLCFCSRRKLNRKQPAEIRSIMQPSTLLSEYQGLSQKLKKSALTNDWENVAYWKEWGKCCISRGSRESQESFATFPLLEIVFPLLKLKEIVI